VLREALQRRNKIQEIIDHAALVDREIASITADQDRVHKNMADLDHNSALYKRYVDQLDAQETKIQALRADATRLHAEATSANQDFKTYLNSVDIGSGQ
jgi:hypothetical protein